MTTLKIGDKAPDFAVEDNTGTIRKLSDYKGKKLVLFFYPRANTEGCTLEACNLRDNYVRFQSLGYEILGVSADTKRKQQNWINKHDFPFPLLADVDKKVIRAYKV